MAHVDPHDNFLLAALSDNAKARLFPQLKCVELPIGATVYEAGQAIHQVYFPTNCIISLMNVMTDGESVEIAIVGNEGVAGIAAFMGGSSTISRATVQSSGWAFQLTAHELGSLFDDCAHVRKLLLNYTQTLMAQMAQTGVCNRHHSIDQRLCRWLLLSLDRLPDSNLKMTQELLATMLGVRRESITEAAGKLQQLGVIRYSRGKITVLNRPLMEKLCCECYDIVRLETVRLNKTNPVCNWTRAHV